jgi:hypothetical protein
MPTRRALLACVPLLLAPAPRAFARQGTPPAAPEEVLLDLAVPGVAFPAGPVHASGG